MNVSNHINPFPSMTSPSGALPCQNTATPLRQISTGIALLGRPAMPRSRPSRMCSIPPQPLSLHKTLNCQLSRTDELQDSSMTKLTPSMTCYLQPQVACHTPAQQHRPDKTLHMPNLSMGRAPAIFSAAKPFNASTLFMSGPTAQQC
jgi:hypothetical protein